MTSPKWGLHERLVTQALEHALEEVDPSGEVQETALRPAEAADRIALHLAQVVERAIQSLPDHARVGVGTRLASRLIGQISQDMKAATFKTESPSEPARILNGIWRRNPDGSAARPQLPLIPLLDTTLLTNSPGEPRVGHQIHTEIATADRIDLIMAFIRRSGLLPLRDELRRHVDSGKSLRVLTTAYTGSTESAALDMLVKLGADVRVSYDTSTTRLHAKAWLFHRESGFSTAYVGSSNLTHSAQAVGLEWNVRLSNARNRAVIAKIAAVFDSYWNKADFEAYDASRFLAAITQPAGAIPLSPIELRLEHFQERLLEQIQISRQLGYHKNLLVSATGTGKTVMAAVDYARLREQLDRSRLLFVAHRKEILEQSRSTFAHALRDGSFGELWVGGARPREFEHVFASIQSLDATNLTTLDPSRFDVVVIDEFHHAAAASYKRLINHVAPRELLGLTATPERSDGESVLHWFGDRIAAELRLWDAIDQHKLTPFAYYGIADDLDLRQIPWRRGQGYDAEALANVITSTDVWARKVLKEAIEHIGDISKVKCLGFCVSISHAQYMQRVFSENGVKARAIWGTSPDSERDAALVELKAGRINVLFSVDLFNEGVDLPNVDTLLMLRPTESPLLFLQQLGRGLRKSHEKAMCTVLDFVGRHRKEFRYDRRFAALLGGSRTAVISQIEAGFPFLPAGCHIELDRVASERVLQSIRNAIPRTWSARAAELRLLNNEKPGISLEDYLQKSGLELADLYRSGRSWSELKEAAGIAVPARGPSEDALRRACGRLLHTDDRERLELWSAWLSFDLASQVDNLTTRQTRLLQMLLSQLFDQLPEVQTVKDALGILWDHPRIREDLQALFEVLKSRIDHAAIPLESLADVPLSVRARYTRIEILAACGELVGIPAPIWQTGVRYVGDVPADVLLITLNKTSGAFSPTTRYRDYAISPELFHWESQSMTREDSTTGRRYQAHACVGSRILVFARHDDNERSFHFLGPAAYVSHEGEMPMAITWKLKHQLPGDLFQSFAAAVA